MAAVSMSKQEFGRLRGAAAGAIRPAACCRCVRSDWLAATSSVSTAFATSNRTVLRVCCRSTAANPVTVGCRRRFVTLALWLVRDRYPDFGPTMAAEKLATQHGCSISRETLRSWMIADGLWIDRRHRLPSPHQPRRAARSGFSATTSAPSGRRSRRGYVSVMPAPRRCRSGSRPAA